MILVSCGMLEYLHALQIGLRSGGSGTCSTCCRLRQVVRIFDKCSRSAALATCSLFGPHARRSHSFISLRLYLVTEILSIPVVVQISLAKVCAVFHSTFVMRTGLVEQLGAFGANNCFSLGAFAVKKTNALIVIILKHLITFLKIFSYLLHLVFFFSREMR